MEDNISRTVLIHASKWRRCQKGPQENVVMIEMAPSLGLLLDRCTSVSFSGPCRRNKTKTTIRDPLERRFLEERGSG